MPITATTTTVTVGGEPKLSGYEHPLYRAFLDVWSKLRHVREGTGGFLDGTYLVPHPREWQDFQATEPRIPTKKLLARRKIASYENIAGAIIDAKKSALFREGPVRRLDGVETDADTTGSIIEWWDGKPGEDSLNAQLQQYWDAAATFGHLYLYLERPEDSSPDAMPYICAYSPIDTPDWMEDKGNLTAVKFIEPLPRGTLDKPVDEAGYRFRVVDEEKWTLYDQQGRPSESAPHGMGRCPVVRLYARRRPILASIGLSVIGDPKVCIDIYNLLSELRELLRNQTFSFLNVPLGTGPDAMSLETAKTLLGTETGTENVVFSGLAAGFISADASNVSAYQVEIDRRLRTLYRTSAIQWEADTRGVEAQGSLSLKREDMNQRLASYADELERTEYILADLWYRAKYGGDLGPQKYKDDDPSITYPDNFDLTPFDEILKRTQSGLSLGMPIEFDKALRKAVLPQLLPGATPDTIEEIEAAIDKQEEPPPPVSILPPRVSSSANPPEDAGKRPPLPPTGT